MDNNRYYWVDRGLSVPAAPITVRARRIYTTRAAALLHVAALYDTARTLYLAALHLSGNNTPVYVWRIPEGQPFPPQPDAVVWPSEGHKGDTMIMKVGGATGRDLHIYFGTHQAITGERDNDVQIAELVGFLTAPMAPNEGEGTMFDSRGLGGDSTPADPIDYDRLDALMMANVERGVTRLAGLFGGGSIRGGIQEKVEDGTATLLTGDPAHDPRIQPYRDALAQFIRDRAYEAVMEALRHPPAPSP